MTLVSDEELASLMQGLGGVVQPQSGAGDKRFTGGAHRATVLRWGRVRRDFVSAWGHALVVRQAHHEGY